MDEVLVFNTAFESELALLAYTLVQHSLMLNSVVKAGIELPSTNGKWGLYYKGFRLM